MPNAVTSGTVEVYGGAPRSVVAISEIRSKTVGVVALRPERVVDEVQDNCEPAPVASVDQPPQPVDSPVRVLRGVGIDPVVTPVTLAGELGHRHQLQGRDAKVFQPSEMLRDPVKCALQRESPNVQLVQHVIAQRNAQPFAVFPVIGGIDDFPTLRARPRVGIERPDQGNPRRLS